MQALLINRCTYAAAKANQTVAPEMPRMLLLLLMMVMLKRGGG